MKMKQRLVVMAAVALVTVVTSCENQGFEEQSSLEETTFVENVFAQLDADVEGVSESSAISSGRFGRGAGFGNFDCASVSEETPEGADYPKTITIDYGDGCEAFNEMVKSGQVIITVTGPREEAGSQKIVTFNNFSVNDHAIEGTRTFTNNGDNSYTVVLEDGKITTPEGEEMTRNSTRTKSLVEGADTDTREDDAWQVTGSASGVNAEGLSWSKSITSPLTISAGCRYIVSGIVQSQTEGESLKVVDFGNGTCDNLYTITQDGETEELEMNFRIKKRGRRGF